MLSSLLYLLFVYTNVNKLNDTAFSCFFLMAQQMCEFACAVCRKECYENCLGCDGYMRSARSIQLQSLNIFAVDQQSILVELVKYKVTGCLTTKLLLIESTEIGPCYPPEHLRSASKVRSAIKDVQADAAETAFTLRQSVGNLVSKKK